MAKPAGKGESPPKVLVVDDDHDTADIMQALLSDEGYAPSVVYDARGEVVRGGGTVAAGLRAPR